MISPHPPSAAPERQERDSRWLAQIREWFANPPPVRLSEYEARRSADYWRRSAEFLLGLVDAGRAVEAPQSHDTAQDGARGGPSVPGPSAAAGGEERGSDV